MNTHVLIFSFSSDKWTVIFYQGLHTHSMQQWVALVSESALRLPKRGAHRGSLWPYSQKGNFVKSREKPSRMFVFRSLLRGAWLPAESSLLSFLLLILSPDSSHLSGISLLPPQLETPGGCLLGQVSGHTGRDYPRGDRGSWEDGSWIILLLQDNKIFLLSIFLVGRKEGRKERREEVKEEKKEGGRERIQFGVYLGNMI